MNTQNTTFNLYAFCQACTDKQNQNYHDFKSYPDRRKADDALRTDFKEKVIGVYGYGNLPQAVKDKVFAMAWESAHSAGYYAVADALYDLLDLVGLVQKESIVA